MKYDPLFSGGQRFSLWMMIIITTLVLLHLSQAVDQSKFRTCAQTSFCHRHRVPLDEISSSFSSPRWSIPDFPSTIDMSSVTCLSFPLTNPHDNETLTAEVYALENGSVRFRVQETHPRVHGPRWQTSDFVNATTLSTLCPWFEVPAEVSVDTSMPMKNKNKMVYTRHCPTPCRGPDWHLVIRNHEGVSFRLELIVNGKLAIIANGQDLFHYETHQEPKVKSSFVEEVSDHEVHLGKTIVDYGEDGLAIYEDGTTQPSNVDPDPALLAKSSDEEWEETFGSHVDSKPYGPASVGLDIAFPACQHVYGIPEHASDFNLKSTRGQHVGDYREPFRLYNLDVFEYELDVPMALYGSIPVMIAHSVDHTVGVFWNNPTETFIDIYHHENENTEHQSHKSSHWISESGIVDVFFLTGSQSQHEQHDSVLTQYTELTSAPALPPLFALGYHQCRWNYKNEHDVKSVNEGFETHVIPYDVLWLDIEHTDGKRYFTWDRQLFPNPVDMQLALAKFGRKMVTIVDPHIKRDKEYRVHQEASVRGMYVKQKDGQTDFEGWCWPGSSSYVDFTSPKARTWWADQFTLDHYKGSTLDLYTWNDMNEPSVFNGPEVSMSKDCRNLEGIEHREWHNLYGTYMQQATMEGQIRRQETQNPKHRPFVLSRAFSAGSQSLGAVWTGDNKAEWAHLAIATKMLLSMSMVSLTFVGADVGGFFGNPEPELLCRWYQMALFQPFFRGHAHHDAQRREPYVLEDPWRNRIRHAIRLRYVLLPYLYTAFYHAKVNSRPILRPLWLEFPQDTATFAIDSSFMSGSDLLIHPVTSSGQARALIYLPTLSSEGEVTTEWYFLNALSQSNVAMTLSDSTSVVFSGGQTVDIDVSNIDSGVPVFQRAGSILCQKRRVRRNSALMARDPYTLQIALSSVLRAHGELYLDDEQSIDSPAIVMEFTFTQDQLVSKRRHEHGEKHFALENTIERIVLLGLASAPVTVTLWTVTKDDHEQAKDLSFSYQRLSKECVIRKPDVGIMSTNWRIHLTY